MFALLQSAGSPQTAVLADITKSKRQTQDGESQSKSWRHRAQLVLPFVRMFFQLSSLQTCVAYEHKLHRLLQLTLCLHVVAVSIGSDHVMSIGSVPTGLNRSRCRYPMNSCPTSMKVATYEIAVHKTSSRARRCDARMRCFARSQCSWHGEWLHSASCPTQQRSNSSSTGGACSTFAVLVMTLVPSDTNIQLQCA